VAEEFAQAVRNAREAGFDGVELHSANGYLPNQFLAPNSNQRSDEYGGSPEKRIRFVLEVLDAMTEAWEPRRIGIRISPAGTFNDINDPDAGVTYPLLVRKLAERNVAWLHIIKPAGSTYGQWDEIRANFPGTTILNSGLTKATGEGLIDSKASELVSYGALYIANPDLPERFSANAPLAAPDQATFYTPGPEGYTTYPTL
jgi:N-ethylmaleimide reductase